MAERTVNVTINYKVNTVEVQKAQAASIAAQKATDDLRKATEAYGKAAKDSNKAAQDALKQTKGSTADVTAEFSSLYSSVRLFLTAGLAKELVDVSLKMATLSGKIEGVEKAFSKLPNSVLILKSLRDATHGTVTDLELMQKALQASNFRIPLEKLGKLFEFAAVKAQQTGQEVNHLVDYIVSGIGYRSIKRLDDLGFTANRVKEALGGVSLQAADMGQVMDAVTKLMDEDLQKTGGYAITSATAVEQLKNKWFELGAEVSKQGTSTGFIGLLTKATDAMRVFAKSGFDVKNIALTLFNEDVTKQSEDMAAAFVKANAALKENERVEDTEKKIFELGTLIKLNKEQNGYAEENIKTLKNEVSELESKNKSIVGLQKLGTEEHKQIKDKEKQISIIEGEINARGSNNAVMAESIRLILDYRDSIKLAIEAENEELGIIPKKKEELEKLRDALDRSRNPKDLGPSGKIVLAIKKLEDEIAQLEGKANDKKKKEANEVQEYLAYLSDLELFQDKKILEERVAARKEANEKEVKDAKEAAEKKKKLEEDLAERQLIIRRMLADAATQILSDQFYAGQQRQLDDFTDKINSTRDFYDEQINLAGDNEARKQILRKESDREIAKLEKERGDREKKAAQAGILVNTALAVIKAYAFASDPYTGAIQAAIVAAEGASQYAIASRARYYAKGKINIDGPGTSTSDSIPAYLSKGESVITAQATRKSLGLLDAIQNNKIDDRVLKTIELNGGRTIQPSFNDKRIVDELKGIRSSQYQLELQGNLLYRVYRDDAGNTKRIRSKSLSS